MSYLEDTGQMYAHDFKPQAVDVELPWRIACTLLLLRFPSQGPASFLPSRQYTQQLHKMSNRISTSTKPPIVASKHYVDWNRHCLRWGLVPPYFYISITTTGRILSRLEYLPLAKPNFLHIGWLVDFAFEFDDGSVA